MVKFQSSLISVENQPKVGIILLINMESFILLHFLADRYPTVLTVALMLHVAFVVCRRLPVCVCDVM